MPISKEPLVGIIMGSDSDQSIMEETTKVLHAFGVSHEIRIISAHRTPEDAFVYAKAAAERGLKILIAGAGMAAHLGGNLAAHTILPVIGVPIDSSPLKGVDALYATVQMPPGVPVGTMAIGKSGAKNAALFAIQILATSNENIQLRDALMKHKKDLADEVRRKDKLLQTKFLDEGE